MTFLVIALLFLGGCSDNKATNTENKIAVNTSEKKTEETSRPETQQTGLVGEWKLIKIFNDTNGNNKLDEDEKKYPITNSDDYMKLNADGSCLFFAVKVKGRYELNKNSIGTETLNIYDKDNTKYNKGRIYSVSATELILNTRFSGSAFWIYKRL